MRPLLSVSELKVHFPVRRGLVRAVDDVSLEVGTAETVGLVGSTGAGKSTLVSLIPRFFDPWSGRVLLDGSPGISERPTFKTLGKTAASIEPSTLTA